MAKTRILVTGGSGFIGTNLIEQLTSSGEAEILNIDIMRPNDTKHSPYWRQCDILNPRQVLEHFKSFMPDQVIHLAARTDTDPKNTLADYEVNTKGSGHVIEAIRNCKSVKRIVFTSTQFIHQYHGVQKDIWDYAPHTVYGESKVIMEQMIRDTDLDAIWTIIRPTNVWGPWHLRYPYEFWKILSRGLYVHPGRQAVMRSYGYVGNVVAQIIAILNSPETMVNKRVFYVGDLPIDLYDWVNGFSLRQTGKRVKVVPRSFVRALAWIGDALSIININFPITSSRYKSMTHSNVAPMETTIDVFGQPPYSLEQGIEETVAWMKQRHPHLVTVK